MKNKLDKVKKVIKDNFVDSGLFNTRSWAGDETCPLYREDGVAVNICYYYGYFEVFGLSEEEFQELDNYYSNLCKKGLRNHLHI